MVLKIISLLSAVIDAIPHIKEAWVKFQAYRQKKKEQKAFKKVDEANTREEIKKAVSDATRIINKRD